MMPLYYFFEIRSENLGFELFMNDLLVLQNSFLANFTNEMCVNEFMLSGVNHLVLRTNDYSERSKLEITAYYKDEQNGFKIFIAKINFGHETFVEEIEIKQTFSINSSSFSSFEINNLNNSWSSAQLLLVSREISEGISMKNSNYLERTFNRKFDHFCSRYGFEWDDFPGERMNEFLDLSLLQPLPLNRKLILKTSPNKTIAWLVDEEGRAAISYLEDETLIELPIYFAMTRDGKILPFL